MKKLFIITWIITIYFLVGLFTNTYSQVFDEPIDSTDNYSFRLYAQSARVPYTVLNEDKEKIDSLIYALIVWTDTTQLILVTDADITATGHYVLKISNYSTGIDTFTTTLTADTFTVSGVDTLTALTDLFWITAYGAAISANDVFVYSILSPNKVIVTRPASGTSGLVYNWRWIRRY
jgi:hypothetical protein